MNIVDSDVRRNNTKGKLSVSVVSSDMCMSTIPNKAFLLQKLSNTRNTIRPCFRAAIIRIHTLSVFCFQLIDIFLMNWTLQR